MIALAANCHRTSASKGTHIPTLDPRDLCGLQTKVEDIQVRLHVLGVGGSRQWNHADLDREPEDDLRDGVPVTGCDLGHLRSGQCLAIGGQQREALVDHVVGLAKLLDLAIPTQQA